MCSLVLPPRATGVPDRPVPGVAPTALQLAWGGRTALLSPAVGTLAPTTPSVWSTQSAEMLLACCLAQTASLYCLFFPPSSNYTLLRFVLQQALGQVIF